MNSPTVSIWKKNLKSKLSILSPAGLNVSILSLDPPPLEIDKTIPGLKRIEIRVSAYLVKDG